MFIPQLLVLLLHQLQVLCWKPEQPHLYFYCLILILFFCNYPVSFLTAFQVFSSLGSQYMCQKEYKVPWGKTVQEILGQKRSKHLQKPSAPAFTFCHQHPHLSLESEILVLTRFQGPVSLILFFFPCCPGPQPSLSLKPMTYIWVGKCNCRELSTCLLAVRIISQ